MTYNYYGVKDDFAWHLATVETALQMRWYKPLLFRESDVVWCQGPRGGVRVVHVRDWLGKHQYGYVRQDSKAMKEFVWIKLRAQDLGPK
jgi:cytochrome c-type biogenesis protein CcmE